MSVEFEKLLSLSDEKDIIETINGCNGKIMIIMRGLPGCGKTTLANKLVDQCKSGAILSTDDYFYQNGWYFYDVSLLSDAHQWNQNRANSSVIQGVSPIIIDNTNLEKWEMNPYMEMATKYNTKYMIIIVEPNTPWRRDTAELARRNVHNIGRDKMERMREKYENDSASVHSVSQINIGSNEPHNSSHQTVDGFSQSRFGNRGYVRPAPFHYDQQNRHYAERLTNQTNINNQNLRRNRYRRRSNNYRSRAITRFRNRSERYNYDNFN